MTQPISDPADGRIAILSPRKFHHHVSRSHGYEFEDVIAAALDDVDFFTPQANPSHKLLNRFKNWMSYKTPLAAHLPVGLSATPLEKDYDLFFYTIAHPRNLNFLSAAKNWRKRSKTAICWVQELWLFDFEYLGSLLDQLNSFDHVICSFTHTAEALQKRLRVPVHYIPWGLDAVHFCPYPNPPARAIDVLCIGARHNTTHRAMIAHSDSLGQFYFYETVSGRAEMADHRAHRHNYVSQLQRCRYFFSYIAKVELGDMRQGQVEFGLRYLEGLGAGAVVLGTRIDSPAFTKHLGWEDAVIEVPYDCPDIGQILLDLDAQPSRMAHIRTRNIVSCLEQHDHLYRWEKILGLAGMPNHPKMQDRRAALTHLIALAQT